MSTRRAPPAKKRKPEREAEGGPEAAGGGGGNREGERFHIVWDAHDVGDATATEHVGETALSDELESVCEGWREARLKGSSVPDLALVPSRADLRGMPLEDACVTMLELTRDIEIQHGNGGMTSIYCGRWMHYQFKSA